uniref:Uncharacterized protein n=1 Tax=Euplotes crassus TaxID=5936 RepID=A0A7S3KKU4_EUPCR|mmetsp:Transcript_27532/g.27403  ORF Transcript_27532/g.27403 Transcript_27532/m.27403 type:complete len:226 (+) Transcript_27532:513-1190(+)|eukprot:CAMPEP_0196996684 /NCGR_PEP_ID=MMETSP1380-20130617/2498_1 /TAXON_ID=5936 /ORGANISM="Euplotes crassus, Strain CT5" /LENGTH=225 /DNA_ID=CAMNT_0042412723 /DNA_START=512 /DNA_END=1189 /DNA_ORIENTATION=+
MRDAKGFLIKRRNKSEAASISPKMKSKGSSKRKVLMSIKINLVVKALEAYTKLTNPDEELMVIAKGCAKQSYCKVERLIYKILKKFGPQLEIEKKQKVISALKSPATDASSFRTLAPERKKRIHRLNMGVSRNKNIIMNSPMTRKHNLTVGNPDLPHSCRGKGSLFVLDKGNKLKLNIRAKKVVLPPISGSKEKGLTSKIKQFLGIQKKKKNFKYIIFKRKIHEN